MNAVESVSKATAGFVAGFAVWILKDTSGTGLFMFLSVFD